MSTIGIYHSHPIFDHLSERNLDVAGGASYSLPMEAIFLVANILWMLFLRLLGLGAILLVMAFILGKTLSRLPNKTSRFVLLFVVFVPFGFAYDYSRRFAYSYSKLPLLEYSKMGWTEALICALFAAILGTLLLPQSHNSNTP